MKQSVHIYIAAHKPCPKYGGPEYSLLQVGAQGKESIAPDALRDDRGSDNISAKNPFYCELTGVYWIWKNAPADGIVGLCHYRRFLGHHLWNNSPEKNILTGENIAALLESSDVILPTPNIKDTVNSWFTDPAELDGNRNYCLCRDAIAKVHPEYLSALRRVFLCPEMSFGNILYTRKPVFDRYAQWLFEVLAQVEADLAAAGDAVLPREMGFLSEWLLNVWVQHNQLKVCYRPVYFLDSKKTPQYLAAVVLERLHLSDVVRRIRYRAMERKQKADR